MILVIIYIYVYASGGLKKCAIHGARSLVLSI